MVGEVGAIEGLDMPLIDRNDGGKAPAFDGMLPFPFIGKKALEGDEEK